MKTSIVKVPGIGDVEICFTRRRYGATIFTWVSYREPGDAGRVNQYGDSVGFHEIGGPWPSISPKRSEIVEAIRLDIDYRKSTAKIAA